MIEAPNVVLGNKHLTTPFTCPIRIYVEHTDYTGLVYHGAYVRFFEQARTEWLNTLGFPLTQLAQENLRFVVRTLNMDFFKPARLLDQLSVTCALVETEKLPRVSFWLQQKLCHNNDILCQAMVHIVCINDNGKPCAIPKILLERMRDA